MSKRPNRLTVPSPELVALVEDGSDADLLRLIADERDRKREWADAALAELHRRHVHVLYAVCVRICSTYLADEGSAEELLYRTMWAVYRTAEKFDPVAAGCADDTDRTAEAVRLWMIRKARWLARDVLTGSEVRHPLQTGGTEELAQVECPDTDADDRLVEEVRRAIDRLPDRDRHLLLAHYFLTDVDNGGPVPAGENIDIYCARRWGTTAASVRKIRSRALEKLRGWLTPASPPVAVAR